MAAQPPPQYRHTHTLSVRSKDQSNNQTKPLVSVVKFSSTGALLGAATNEGTLSIWNTQSLNEPSTNQTTSPTHVLGGDSGINDLSWSGDDRYVCTASDDKMLYVYDVETGLLNRTFRGHAHYVSCCVFHPSGLIVSGSYDETVKIWDLRSNKPARTLSAHNDPVCSVSTNREGSYIVSGSYDGLCRVWDFTSAQCLKTVYADNSPPVSSVKFTPNGKFLLTSYLDSTIKLWDYEKNDVLKTYTGHTNKQFCLFNDFCVTHKRKYIASGSEDGYVYMFDIQNRAIVQKLSVSGDLMTPPTPTTGLLKHGCISVTCHPTAHLIASSSPLTSKQNEINVFSDTESELVIEQQTTPSSVSQTNQANKSPSAMQD